MNNNELVFEEVRFEEEELKGLDYDISLYAGKVCGISCSNTTSGTVCGIKCK